MSRRDLVARIGNDDVASEPLITGEWLARVDGSGHHGAHPHEPPTRLIGCPQDSRARPKLLPKTSSPPWWGDDVLAVLARSDGVTDIRATSASVPRSELRTLISSFPACDVRLKEPLHGLTSKQQNP